MEKNRAFNKGYNFFLESYIHEPLTTDKFGIKATCWRSQRKNEKSHELSMAIKLSDAAVISGLCYN